MLNRVFKILETISEGGLDFRLADRRYPHELLEFPEQGQRLAVAHQLAQDVVEVAEGKSRKTERDFTLLRKGEEPVSAFGEGLVVYWFGFVDEAENPEGIYITDSSLMHMDCTVLKADCKKPLSSTQ